MGQRKSRKILIVFCLAAAFFGADAKLMTWASGPATSVASMPEGRRLALAGLQGGTSVMSLYVSEAGEMLALPGATGNDLALLLQGRNPAGADAPLCLLPGDITQNHPTWEPFGLQKRP